MHPHFITTDGGEELVILPRRDYDAMLARLGDEEAEDRMTVLLAREARRDLASGDEQLIPAVADGRPPAQMPTGARIRGVRRASGFSQMRLAEEAGITQGYLSDIEGGRKKPTVEVIERICKALGIEPETL